MPRYDRIPARTESSRDSDVQFGSLTLSRSQSSGSYASIGSNEEDFLNNQDNYDNSDNSDTEISPLHSNQNCNDDPAGENGLSSDEGVTFPSRSISPRAIYPSITAGYSNSFDLDDDDDDDMLEANLKRYNLDFSATDKVASLADNGIVNNNDGNHPFGSRGTSLSNRCTKATRYVWFSFQLVRQQARQRRAQLLLQQTERNWRQSLKICLITNCDATDSGILLVAAAMVVWILLLILVKNPTVRRGWIVGGILFFIIRFGTRPLYHFVIRQLQKRQRHHQQHGESSQTSPGSEIRHGDDQHHHLSNGNLELHTIRGDSNNTNGSPLSTSVGSDPTIAAI